MSNQISRLTRLVKDQEMWVEYCLIMSRQRDMSNESSPVRIAMAELDAMKADLIEEQAQQEIGEQLAGMSVMEMMGDA